MHIPDGFLDTKTWATAAVASTATIAYAANRANKEFEEKDAPLMGVLAAFIFAAQMLNFPVAGGTSGHFMGGALAAILLGPWKAILVMFSVVSLQALLFGDGGIAALGANILNMAIISPIVGFWIYSVLKRFKVSAAAFTAGLGSIVVAALACGAMLALSGTAPFSIVMPLMGGWHVLIGIGEGLITATTVAYLLKVRPDLVKENAGLDFKALTVLAGVAAFLALFLSPFASSFPDGLEYVAEKVGFLDKDASWFGALIPDYVLPGVSDERLATGLAGIVGVAIMVAIGFAVAALAKRKVAKG